MILSGYLHSIWLSNFFKNTDKNVQFSTGRMTIPSKLNLNNNQSCASATPFVWLSG